MNEIDDRLRDLLAEIGTHGAVEQIISWTCESYTDMSRETACRFVFSGHPRQHLAKSPDPHRTPDQHSETQQDHDQAAETAGDGV